MKKTSFVFFVAVLFLAICSLGAGSQAIHSEKLCEVWLGAKAQATSLPNLGITPVITFEYQELPCIDFFTSIMSKEEAWVGVNVDLFEKDLELKLGEQKIASIFHNSLFGALIFQGEQWSVQLGIKGGFIFPFYVYNYPMRLEADIGLGMSLDLKPRIFFQVGLSSIFRILRRNMWPAF